MTVNPTLQKIGAVLRRLKTKPGEFIQSDLLLNAEEKWNYCLTCVKVSVSALSLGSE